MCDHFLLQPTNPFVHVEPADELCSPLEGGDDVYDPSFMLPFFAHHLEAGDDIRESPLPVPTD